jgi:CBS domain-containing protein
MAKAIRDVMTPNPATLPLSAALTEAAEAMRSSDIGAVVVMDESKPCGVVTDRDLVVRAIARNKDPKATRLDEICSRELVGLRPDDTTDQAVQLMRQNAIRRLVVLDNGKVVGIVSLGDLALALDSSSALADISAAAPNR